MELIKEGKFKYLETLGGEKNLLLLHGLFGELSNFQGIIDYFGDKYNVVTPILPIYDLPLRKVGIRGYLNHVIEFVEFKGYNKVNVLGNSLGGHISMLYAFQQPDKMESLTLTGSSGLFENSLGSTFPKRGNYEYIKRKTEETFYDPKIATKELVDEVFGIVNDRNRAIRVVITAKSAIRHNVGDRLQEIKVPVLLVWGKNDTITPPFVADQFHEKLSDSEVHIMDKTGHAPMMERPKDFNVLLEDFLNRRVNIL